MRCPYCGGFNPDNKNFCIRCGRDLVASTPNPTAQRPAQPTRPTQNQPAQQQTAYQAPYKPTPPPGGSRPSLPAQPPASYPPPNTIYAASGLSIQPTSEGSLDNCTPPRCTSRSHTCNPGSQKRRYRLNNGQTCQHRYQQYTFLASSHR